MVTKIGIQPKELLKGAWQNKQHKETLAPNVTLMIQRFNQLSRWVQTCIVQSEKVKDRVQYMKTFLKIASVNLALYLPYFYFFFLVLFGYQQLQRCNDNFVWPSQLSSWP